MAHIVYMPPRKFQEEQGQNYVTTLNNEIEMLVDSYYVTRLELAYSILVLITCVIALLYINGYLHDVHEAEELMLDVFAYLFTKKPRIQDGGFKAYLYKAARHMALRHKSKRKPLFSLDALTGEPDGRLLAEEVIRTEERNRILHFCMGEMNPDFREVLYLTYFEDMSYAQAAEVTGKTVKQITNMVYRGKESLRRLLEREGITNAES